MENNMETTGSDPKPQEKKSLPLASLVVVILVIVIGFILYTKTAPKIEDKPKLQANTGSTLPEDTENFIIDALKPIDPSEHILGNPNAKVFIVEFSDTECPFCKLFHSTVHRVIAEKGDEVAWVYRHYPIEQLHSKAFHEAVASECAWAQGGNDMFWKYIDQVYARTTSNNTLDPQELSTIASDLKLDKAKFKTCLDNEEYKDKVDATVNEGLNMQIQGTPTSFIVVDGKVVDTVLGAVRYDTLLKKVNAQLSN